MYDKIPIISTDQPVNVLGIVIPENLEDLCTMNYNNKLRKTVKILQTWRRKPLTLFVKMPLVNFLVVLQFIYLFMSIFLTPSQSFFEFYEQKIFEFFWSNKPEKIKKGVF